MRLRGKLVQLGQAAVIEDVDGRAGFVGDALEVTDQMEGNDSGAATALRCAGVGCGTDDEDGLDDDLDDED